MHKSLMFWLVSAAFCGAVLHGCGSSPAASDPAADTNADRTEAVRLTEVPPPPGIPPQAVAVIVPPQSERAAMTLDAILDSLTRPPHLVSREDNGPASDAQPPLAAQQFYATGRQALLVGDNFAAIQAFDKALRLSPNEAAILRGLGQAWARAGNRVSAANHYRQAFSADPTDLDSVFMLGRFSLDERRWDAAVLNFDAARRLTQSGDDTRAASINADTYRLVSFYLANALNQAGYARAAVEMYGEYLADAGSRSSGNSRYGRELSIIDAQQGETLALVGDLYHRLDQPEQALSAYRVAAEIGVLNPDTLLRRLVYTRLRLGQPRAAEALVIRAVTDSGGDTQMLELIEYAVGQGVPADRLSDRLAQLYRDQDQPAALVLALADVLSAEDAAALLSEHLRTHPGDDAVFGKLLSVSISEPLDADDRATLTDRTVSVMAARPELAGRYAEQLIQNLEAPQALLVGYPEYQTPGDSPPAADEDKPRRAVTAFLHGQLLATADQPDAAADAYRFAIEQWGELTAARLELAAYHVDRSEYDEAEALLLPLGDRAPARAIELRVRALTQTARYDEALALLNQSADPASPSNRLKLQKAALLLELDRVPEAERTLLDALNARPTDEEIYAALLKLYEANPDLRQNQVRLIRRMIETIPNARITRFIRVEYLLANRNYNEALQLLDLLSQSDGEAERIVRYRLEAFIGLRRPDKVVELAEQHLDTAGTTPDNELLGRAIGFLSRSGEDERAVQLEERFWNAQPVSATRSLGLGRVYSIQDRYEESIAVAREALSQGPTVEQKLDAYELLIIGLFNLERKDEAEQILAAAMEGGAPEDGANVFQLLAFLYDEAGDTDGSRRVLEDGLKHYPMNASMNNTLGYGLANDGLRLDDARKMIERALATQPDVGAYLDSLGWVYYKLGDFEEALEWLEKSQAALPGEAHPVILDHLGDTLYRLGREAEAVRSWNQARMRLLTPGYVKEDPEEEGLEDRLAAKIEAVAEDRPSPVAPLGQGIELPQLEDDASETDTKSSPQPLVIEPAETSDIDPDEATTSSDVAPDVNAPQTP